MDRKILFLFFGLIVLITQCVNCVPLAKSEEDSYDYQEDPKDDSLTYDDDDFEEDDKRASSTQGSPTEDKDYITESYVEIVEIGSSITLKCKGVDFDKETLYMWFNDTNIIVQGKTIRGDRGIIFDQVDGSITIKNIQSTDDGKYRCRAFTKKSRYETNIELEVTGPPSQISIGHNQGSKPDIANQTISYKVGEKDLRFKCNPGNSRPAVKVTWNHNGNVIEPSKDHDISIDQSLLFFKTLHAKHAGKYECDASNDRGNIKAYFELDVQYAPFFKDRHHKFFNAEIGSDAEVYCLYRSSPATKSVKWFKGSVIINESDKYSVSNDEKEHHERTKLMIKNVVPEDLTKYSCEVQNDLGTKRENITLGLVPAPPKYEGFKYINGVLFTDWIVKSHQELMSMQILFRNKENVWNTTDAQITNKNKIQHRHGEWRVQGSINLDAGDWQISGRAKNTEGWSDDGETAHLKLPKDEIESGKSTSAASSVTSTVCGLVAMLIARYFV